MAITDHRGNRYVRWACELLFSIYLAQLLVSVNLMMAEYSWAWRLRSFYLSHWHLRTSVGIDDSAGVRFAGFLVGWLLAVAIFSVIRVLGSFSITQVVLGILTGLIAVVGLPLAHIYSGHPCLFFLKLELILGIGGVVLFVLKKWAISRSLSILLLALHFGLWSAVIWNSFSLGFDMLRPYFDNYLHMLKPELAYVLFAFFCSLLWGFYVRKPGDIHDE